ncbi:MAG: polysaccharide deacetylase family protein [Oscillospiraceae bacterium]|jgi:peptidoglycan/xylan/chitin deacetylase (PgdA/CDA1 family)|nr:polysaccharide deacetylase family protein [Oscillospiraceae bacterium]
MEPTITPSRHETAVLARKYGYVFAKSRLIRRVAAPLSRTVALVFDDSPCSLPAEGSDTPVTEMILTLLREYGARATFSVYGGTGECYPDTPGRAGSRYERGRKFAHYPAFALDDMGGVAALPELTRAIARDANELAFTGFLGLTYASVRALPERVTFRTDADALDDFTRLSRTVFDLTKLTPTFAAPPRGVATLPSGADVFTLYETVGCHHLKPQIDLSPMMPSDAADWLRGALASNPAALSGAILGLRGGLGADGETQSESALRSVLETLTRLDFRVVSVGELLALSAFEDLPPNDTCYDAVRRLDRAGWTVGFRNNRFYPDREFTRAELLALAGGTESRPRGVNTRSDDAAHPLAIAAAVGQILPNVTGQPRSNKRRDVYEWLTAVDG